MNVKALKLSNQLMEFSFFIHEGCTKKTSLNFRRSFCLIFLTTNMLEGWDIIPLKILPSSAKPKPQLSLSLILSFSQPPTRPTGKVLLSQAECWNEQQKLTKVNKN